MMRNFFENLDARKTPNGQTFEKEKFEIFENGKLQTCRNKKVFEN